MQKLLIAQCDDCGWEIQKTEKGWKHTSSPDWRHRPIPRIGSLHQTRSKMKIDDPVRKSIEARANKLQIRPKKARRRFINPSGWKNDRLKPGAKPRTIKVDFSKSEQSTIDLYSKDPDQRKEAVNHPVHYGGDTTYEVIKVLRAWGLLKNFCLGNAVKYIARHDKKERSLEDLKKAAWYLNFEIQEMEKAIGSPSTQS